MSLSASAPGRLLADRPVLAVCLAITFSLCLYLLQLNRLLSGVPGEVRAVAQEPWIEARLRESYRRLERKPISPDTYRDQLPPKLGRRYIVTGGSGLVGGHIVLQLLARGQPPESIRIVDFQRPHRADMLLPGPTGARDVGFVQTDISSAAHTEAAFTRPWPASMARLPLTVFHTAAVIVPSDRSPLVYGFCRSVNVEGTRNVLEAARRAGADVLIATTSASISIRPVGTWVSPFRLRSWPENFWQVLDEADFFRPLRAHGEFFGNYPASKAAAERIVCEADGMGGMRTGCIRPANGVYGHPTDNTVGGPLNMEVYPAWGPRMVQPFVHGANVAIAHLQFEAVLASPSSSASLIPQAGRPFVVTDPNPPISYGDLWFLVATLATTPFRTILLPPAPVLLLAHAIEWLNLLPYWLAACRWTRFLARAVPRVPGPAKHLQPALFSITTHLVATNEAAGRPVAEGGLGYIGVMTTEEGMVQEVVEWNREHAGVGVISPGEPANEAARGHEGGEENTGVIPVKKKKTKPAYTSSVSLAEEIHRIRATTATVTP